jgi:hypothetical protein
MSQFTAGPTRDVQAGDTPDLNDGLLSRLIVDTLNLVRGQACMLVSGEIVLATQTLSIAGHSPFVPIESVDNTGDGLEASGVTAPQRVALEAEASSATIFPGDYVKASSGNDGTVERWVPTTDDDHLKYARYLGKEAALLDRAVATPFDETLTPGIVPDQALIPTAVSAENIGWYQLLEAQGGGIT